MVNKYLEKCIQTITNGIVYYTTDSDEDDITKEDAQMIAETLKDYKTILEHSVALMQDYGASFNHGDDDKSRVKLALNLIQINNSKRMCKTDDDYIRIKIFNSTTNDLFNAIKKMK